MPARRSGQADGAAHRVDRRRTPVQSSKLAAPWATSTSSPSRTRAPAAAAASAVAVRGYGRSISVCPSPQLEQHLVAHRRRVDHEVGVAHVRRPLAAPGEDARLRQRVTERRRRAAVSHDRRLVTSLVTCSRIAASVEKPRPRTIVFTDGSSEPRSRATSSLYGAVTFAYSTSAHAASSSSGRTSRSDVLPVEPGRGEGRVLHPGRERVRHRMAEQHDLSSRTGPRAGGSPGSST